MYFNASSPEHFKNPKTTQKILYFRIPFKKHSSISGQSRQNRITHMQLSEHLPLLLPSLIQFPHSLRSLADWSRSDPKTAPEISIGQRLMATVIHGLLYTGIIPGSLFVWYFVNFLKIATMIISVSLTPWKALGRPPSIAHTLNSIKYNLIPNSFNINPYCLLNYPFGSFCRTVSPFPLPYSSRFTVSLLSALSPPQYPFAGYRSCWRSARKHPTSRAACNRLITVILMTTLLITVPYSHWQSPHTTISTQVLQIMSTFTRETLVHRFSAWESTCCPNKSQIILLDMQTKSTC